MSLEQRILDRWKDWWVDKVNQPVDRLLMQLIVIALEEVQKGMTEPRFTVKEAIALEHLLSNVQAFVSPKLPITSMKRVEAISKLITPEVLSAHGKLHMELDNLRQAQEVVVGFGEAIASEDGTTTGGEG